jgi:hypothetical protein
VYGPTEGGCNCGKIKVRLKAMGRTVVCRECEGERHLSVDPDRRTGRIGGMLTPDCTTCRRFTGSISAYLATVARDDLEIIGCPKLYSSIADSGNAVTRMFCGECGR